jgi:hypothetical protein
MNDQCQKAMDIARKTGDRLIIFDTAKTNEAFVIMSLDEYEKNIYNVDNGSNVTDLTEDELLDKINSDIAAWKSEKENRKNKEEKINNFRKNYGRLMSYEDEEDDDCGCCGFANDRNDDYFDEEDDFFPPNEFSAPLHEYDDYKESNKKESRQKRRNPWDIPTERKKAAEEIIEEDRQYLEDL